MDLRSDRFSHDHIFLFALYIYQLCLWLSVGETYHHQLDLFALLQTYFPPFGIISLVALHSPLAMVDIAAYLLV